MAIIGLVNTADGTGIADTDSRYPQLAHTHAGTTNGNKLAQANTHESPDTDTATTSLHHTIGAGANQAAAGNHTHATLHTQGTDTGTTGTTFTVDSDATTGKIAITAAAGASDKTLTLTNAALTDNRTITLPDATGTVVLGGAVTSSNLTMATARLLGRTTASTGVIEEITVGTGLSLSGGSLTATGGGGGAVTFNEPAADNSAGTQSIFDSATVGESVAFPNLLYLKSDSKWWKADANAAATMPGLRMALESKTADQTCSLIAAGRVRDDDWNWTVGGLIFASAAVVGGLTQTPPSGSADVVQIVGIAYHADKIIFAPEADSSEVQ